MCFGGGGNTKSSSSSSGSSKSDPSVGKPNMAGKTKSSSGTVSVSKKPKAKPDTSSTSYKVKSAVSKAVSDFSKDVSMGTTVFGKDKAAGSEALKSKGYSQSEISDYYARTEETAKLTYPNDPMSNKSYDQPQKTTPSIINTGGAATPAPTPAPTPTPTPVVPVAPPPVGETPETFVPGPTETAVVEEAKKKKGYAGTIETTPSGLMTEAKTRKKRSLMSSAQQAGLMANGERRTSAGGLIA